MTLNDLIISPLTKVRFNMYKLTTTDSESLKEIKGKDEIQHLYIASFFDGTQYYDAYSPQEITNTIRKLLNKYNKLTIVAHNYKYDAKTMGLIHNFTRKAYLGLDSKIKMLDKIIFVKYSSKNGERVLQFLDSYNYFKDSLHNLGEMINEKKVWDNEYTYDIYKWNKEVRTTGSKAVREDCRILYDFFNKFITNANITLGVSIASSSMNTFRKDFLKRIISFPKALVDDALSSYHGGKVLAYRLGMVEAKYYDVNSLYPFEMKKHRYSYKFHKELKEYKYIYDDVKNDNYNYLMNVTYNVKDHSPILYTYKGKLIPFLQNTQWITGKEYQKLYELNADIQINKAYEFHSDYIFREFVDTFYNLRRKSTSKEEKQFYKIILNSLYGKMGQHKATSEFIAIDEIQDLVLKYLIDNNKDKERILYNDTMVSIYDDFVTLRKELPVRYNPLIASEVTANARIDNFNYTEIIGFDNIVYTDTDSFFTTKPYPSQYVSSSELGKLKLEDKMITEIFGVKDYTYVITDYNSDEFHNFYIEHNVIKGVPKSAITFNDSGIFKATYKQWSSLKSKQSDVVILTEVTKELKRKNDKMKYIDNIGVEWENPKEYERVMC